MGESILRFPIFDVNFVLFVVYTIRMQILRFFDVLQSFHDKIWRISRNIMNIHLQNAIFLMSFINLSIFLCIFAPMKLLNKK